MERMEKLDHRDSKVCLVQWDHLETRGPWENKVKQETLGQLVNKDPEETLVKMVDQVTMGPQDPLALQEKGVLQAVLVLGDSRVCLDLQAKMVCQERTEKLVFKVHQA